MFPRADRRGAGRLEVGRVDDPAEAEADRIAADVVRRLVSRAGSDNGAGARSGVAGGVAADTRVQPSAPLQREYVDGARAGSSPRIRLARAIQRDPSTALVAVPASGGTSGGANATEALDSLLPELPDALRIMVAGILEAARGGQLRLTEKHARPLLGLLRALITATLHSTPGEATDGAGAMLPNDMVAITRVVSSVIGADVTPYVQGADIFVSMGWLLANAPEVLPRRDELPAPPLRLEAAPDDVVDNEATDTEERERAEREKAEREEREKAEREERERAEREKAEREERERAEREKAEREAREKQEREKAEREAREKQEREEAEARERVNYGAPNLSPAEFAERGLAALAEFKARGGALKGNEKKFYEASIAKAQDALQQLQGKPKVARYLKPAKDSLAKVATEAAAIGHDPVAEYRAEVLAEAEGLKRDAEQLTKAYPTGVAGEHAAHVLVSAKDAVTNARSPNMTKTKQDVERVATEVRKLKSLLTRAAADLPMFGVVVGSVAERLGQLEALRNVLSESAINELMPSVPDTGGAARGDQLVDLVKVAEAHPSVGLDGLRSLLNDPGFSTDLADIVVLGTHLELSLDEIRTRRAQLVTIVGHCKRHELTWFAGMRWPTVVDLLSAFTGSELASFVRQIDRARLGVLLDHAVTAATMKHYFDNAPDVLKSFNGVPNGAWEHIVQIHHDPNTRSISGGHDKARFTGFINKLADPLGTFWVTVPEAAGISKVAYQLTYSDGNVGNGIKTLIDGLIGGGWRARAEEAAWDAFRSNAFATAGATWSGSDGTGQAWKGFRDGGSITTVFPDV